MLTDEEVKTLITDLENDRVERTTSTREDKLGPAVCAFSNDFPNHNKPGVILLGVNDDGSIAGMKWTDEELQKIGGVRSNGNVLPQPVMTVSIVYKFPEGEVVAVVVHPSFYPPVRFNGRVWIRVGPRRAIANEAEERKLSEKRTSSAKTFDIRPSTESKLDDLNIDLFKMQYLPQAIDKETLGKNKRDLKEQLSSLRLYDLVHDCPTHAGLILLGINPQYWMPGNYIQYIKFNTTELTPSFEFEKVFSGALITELSNVDDFIKGNILKSRTIPVNSLKEERIYNYPFWAIRELIMNAIMHRDYESNAPILIYDFTDRIEIINSGGLFGEARPENFPNASDYRNPAIAEAMKLLGYVNRYNFGVYNAQKELRANNNPEAIFRLDLVTKFQVSIPINSNW